MTDDDSPIKKTTSWLKRKILTPLKDRLSKRAHSQDSLTTYPSSLSINDMTSQPPTKLQQPLTDDPKAPAQKSATETVGTTGNESFHSLDSTILPTMETPSQQPDLKLNSEVVTTTPLQPSNTHIIRAAAETTPPHHNEAHNSSPPTVTSLQLGQNSIQRPILDPLPPSEQSQPPQPASENTKGLIQKATPTPTRPEPSTDPVLALLTSTPYIKDDRPGNSTERDESERKDNNEESEVELKFPTVSQVMDALPGTQPNYKMKQYETDLKIALYELNTARLTVAKLQAELSDNKQALDKTKQEITIAKAQSELPSKSDNQQCKETRDTLYFRGWQNPLSAFYPCTITDDDGNKYKSAEHCFQYKKLKHHELESEAIRAKNAQNAARAKAIARKALPQTKESWRQQERAEMERINVLKANQCQVFRNTLLDSGDVQLVHNIETDSHWGFGTDGKGSNLMGESLMTTRLIVRNQPPQHTQEDDPPAKKRQLLIVTDSMLNGLEQFFSDDSNTEVEVITYSGGTAASIAEELYSAIDGKKPTATVIHCGTNSLENVEKAGIEKAFAKITNDVYWHTGAHIILSGIIHRQDTPHLNTRADSVNRHLQTLESDQVTFVDHNPTFRNLSRILDKRGLHLRPAGKKQVADNLWLVLNTIGDDKPKSLPPIDPALPPSHNQHKGKSQATSLPANGQGKPRPTKVPNEGKMKTLTSHHPQNGKDTTNYHPAAQKNKPKWKKHWSNSDDKRPNHRRTQGQRPPRAPRFQKTTDNNQVVNTEETTNTTRTEQAKSHPQQDVTSNTNSVKQSEPPKATPDTTFAAHQGSPMTTTTPPPLLYRTPLSHPVFGYPTPYQTHPNITQQGTYPQMFPTDSRMPYPPWTTWWPQQQPARPWGMW